ncbi:MAG: PP2C family protein-serine/threonine phosphatase [Bacteroidota bacterium]
MDTPNTQNGFSDRLGTQIESLQGSFRKLSRAASVKELAQQFAAVLRDIFSDAAIDLYHRSEAEGEWEHLTGTGSDQPDEHLTVPQNRTASTCCLSKSGTSLAIVQRLVDRSYVCLILRKKARGATYSDVDVVSVRLFFHLFDNAYQTVTHKRSEKDLVFSLNHRVLQLTSLIDTGIEVSKLDQATTVHSLALERAASLTNASKGIVKILEGDRLKDQVVFPAGTRTDDLESSISRISSEFTFEGDTYTMQLFEKESRSGTVPFEETDQLLLDALARQVHASLENRSLLQQAIEKEKIEKELSVAASIQQMILPKTLPAIEGYDVAGINIPTISVGGDYYDCIALPDGRYALVVADVAGKGMPAALLVSSLHAYLSAYLETQMSLAELSTRLNRAIYNASPDDRFITAIVVMLDPSTGEIESANLGHNIGYVLRKDNSVQELKEGGLALGMLDIEFPYTSEKFTLEPGERLWLYSDGVPEATNDQHDLFDQGTPLPEYTQSHKPDQAQGFIDQLIGEIKAFTGNAPQSDDITALYLLRK